MLFKLVTMTSYQKLKKKVEELEKEIQVLVNKPESTQAQEIKYRYKLASNLERIIWFGNPLRVH